jgi:glutathione S-transferase
MAAIYHLAESAHWADAVRAGRYAQSTRGRTLAQEGFLHASTAQQWPQVRRRFYADLSTDLVLLTIDPARLGLPLRFEVGDPATGELFPHVYGALDVDAVVATRVLPPPHA